MPIDWQPLIDKKLRLGKSVPIDAELQSLEHISIEVLDIPPDFQNDVWATSLGCGARTKALITPLRQIPHRFADAIRSAMTQNRVELEPKVISQGDSPLELSVRDNVSNQKAVRIYPASRSHYRHTFRWNEQLASAAKGFVLSRYNKGRANAFKSVFDNGGLTSPESALAGGTSQGSGNSALGIENAIVADISEPLAELLAADEQGMFADFLNSLQHKPLQVAAKRLFVGAPTDDEKGNQQEMFWLLFERTITRAHRELMSDSTLSSGRSWQAPEAVDRQPGQLSEQQLPQLMEQLIEVLKYIPLRDFASLLDKQYLWLCGELTEDRTRLVLDRNLEGDTVEEIAAKIKRAKKSVQRELKTIRQRLGFS